MNKPDLAFTENLEMEMLLDGEAKLGDTRRCQHSIAASIVNGSFGVHPHYYGLWHIPLCLRGDEFRIDRVKGKALNLTAHEESCG